MKSIFDNLVVRIFQQQSEHDRAGLRGRDVDGAASVLLVVKARRSASLQFSFGNAIAMNLNNAYIHT
jgi:hypothetical protein